jgi:SAM-dependent methyltransferase
VKDARTEDVRRLYETYPYPYGAEHTDPDLLLVYVLRGLFYLEPLKGWRILDAGCGTGHKLTGLAITYTGAQFTGVDLSSASVSIAQSLQQRFGLTNMQVTQGDILRLAPEPKYDLVLTLGVIHHLENPQQGLLKLAGALAPDGILSVWLYHSIGEFERLMRRDLLLSLWDRDWAAMSEGQELMEQLGLSLESHHYGPRETDASALEANADAYMHPIVNAYRFGEAIELLRAAGMEWVAIDFINLRGTVKLIDLAEEADAAIDPFRLTSADLFASEQVRERYRQLSPLDRLTVIELAMRPRGFHLVAGRGDSYRKLVAPRLRDNAIGLAPSDLNSARVM